MESASHRRAVELALVASLGVLNVLSDTLLHAKTAVVLLGAALWLGYLGLCVRSDRQVVREWGFRLDNAADASRLVAIPTAIAMLAMLAFAAATGRLSFPVGLWLTLAVYPVWGVAQQLLLNAMLARNLEGLLPAKAVVPVAATLFSLSHAPDLPVMALTFPAGLLWAWIYRRTPNLWVLGLAHGILGTLAYYWVLGRDPWVTLLGAATTP